MRVELPAQVTDVCLDLAELDPQAPDALEDLLARVDALRAQQEEAKQPELGGRQVHCLPTAPHLVRALDEDDVGEPQHGLSRHDLSRHACRVAARCKSAL